MFKKPWYRRYTQEVIAIMMVISVIAVVVSAPFSKINEVRSELKSDISELRTEMNSKFAEVIRLINLRNTDDIKMNLYFEHRITKLENVKK